jgi:hypothetical protein
MLEKHENIHCLGPLWNKRFTKHRNRKKVGLKCPNTSNPTRFQNKGRLGKMPLKANVGET